MKLKLNKKTILLAIAAGLAGFTAVAWLLLTGPRMHKQPSLRAFETQVNLPPEQSVAYSWNRKSVSEMEAIANTDGNVQKGKVYYGYYCILCHGTFGKGNGPVGQSYIPKPADLTADSIRNYNFSELRKASFSGTGHDRVMERVVPEEYRPFILLYIQQQYGQ